MLPNNMVSIFEFGSLCYDFLGFSCLNGTDKIINLVIQFRFSVLRNTSQHISYNIYATFILCLQSAVMSAGRRLMPLGKSMR